MHNFHMQTSHLHYVYKHYSRISSDSRMKHHHASYTVITYSNVTQIISNHQISLSKLTRLALNTGLIVWRWFSINYARRDYAVFISFCLLITIKGTNGWRAVLSMMGNVLRDHVDKQTDLLHAVMQSITV